MSKKQSASSTSSPAPEKFSGKRLGRPLNKKPSRRPRTRNYVLSDGTPVVADDNNKKYVTKKNVFKTQADEELTLPKPKDAISKHKYPPPKKNKIFRDKWSKFIDLVVDRDSFRVAHLDTLEILCDLYVELEELNTFVRTNGMTFEQVTLTGKDRKQHLEVGRRDKVRVQIQNYTKFLDLFPKKDKSAGGDSDGESGEWS